MYILLYIYIYYYIYILVHLKNVHFFFHFLHGRVLFPFSSPFSSSVFSTFFTLAGSARGAALLGRPGGLWAGLLGWSLGHFPCPGVFLTFSIRFLYVFYYSSDAEAFLGKHCPGSPVAGPVWFLSVFVRLLCVFSPVFSLRCFCPFSR